MFMVYFTFDGTGIYGSLSPSDMADWPPASPPDCNWLVPGTYTGD